METRRESAQIRYWLAELTAAKKREADYRKDGERILEIYEGKRKMPFNILYSNTETLMPALYSATPIPVVQRRFKDEDPLGRAAALAGQRLLAFLLDTNLDGYDTFDEGLRGVTLDALLPGRGNLTVKYDATLMGGEASEGEEAVPYMQAELVCVNRTQWNRVYYGYARKWSDVPWVAYEWYVDRAEVQRLFGKAWATKLVYTDAETKPGQETSHRDEDAQHHGERKTVRLYQIWDKDGGKVIRYLCEQVKDQFLKVEEDPLGLTGFFNCPKPLHFLEKTHSLIPTALYCLYEEQAVEVNKLTTRIRHIVNAVKARGVYDSALGEDLKHLMEADDNELIPADKSSSLAADKGMEHAIWFMPVEKLIGVLRELYVAREQAKQVIYEITGISDILRGASKASETLGAQEIKTQWGTLRLKHKQAEVQRFARDVLRMMLELAATKFSEDTWAKMTGLPFVTTMQRQQLELVLMAAQTQGLPPDPQAMAQLQQPVWGQVIEALRDDLQRAYRIDIETNSTVEPEAADDHKQIQDLLMALSQYLNGVGPLVAKGVLPFQAAQGMMLAITRRFRWGQEIEDYIKAMQPPAPEHTDGEQQRQQAQQTAQKELQFQQKEAELAIRMKQMEAEMALKQKEADLQMRELELKMAQDQLRMERQAAQQELALKAQGEHQKLAFEQKSAQLQNTKFKTENVVNQKADQTLGKGVSAMQDMVKTLVATVAQQSNDHHAMLTQLTQALSKRRVKRAVRGTDGRIEQVVEEVA